jgi:hypothetical protein
MRNLKVIILFAIFFIAMSVTSALAQRRPENTRSAQAAYGYPNGGHKSKKANKKKKQKQKKRKPSNGATPLYRKKNPWAN